MKFLGATHLFVCQIPGVREVLKIKGVGLVTVAGILAEAGDLVRFDHPKQIIKLASLNLKENSSGKHKARTETVKGLAVSGNHAVGRQKQ